MKHSTMAFSQVAFQLLTLVTRCFNWTGVVPLFYGASVNLSVRSWWGPTWTGRAVDLCLWLRRCHAEYCLMDSSQVLSFSRLLAVYSKLYLELLKYGVKRRPHLPLDTWLLVVISLYISSFIVMNLFWVSACLCFRSIRALAISFWNHPGFTVLMICSVIEACTYVEEELAIDCLSGRLVWKVNTYVLVLIRHLFEVSWIELLVPRNVDGTEFSVR